jgi:hypothetical protein
LLIDFIESQTKLLWNLNAARRRYQVHFLHAHSSGGGAHGEAGAVVRALQAHDAALAASRQHGDAVTSFDW